MSRLVVISNRLADPRKSAAGGLAVALGDALSRTGGLWFGWSGTVTADGTPGEGALQTHQAGNVTLATVDLCQADHAAYYQGYANSVLWPVLHYRLDLADFSANYSEGYRRVNQMFARKLLPLLREDDVIWVHDYHLIRWRRSCARWVAASASVFSCMCPFRHRSSSQRCRSTSG